MSQLQASLTPANHNNREELVKDYELICSNQLTVSILNAIPTQILLLNTERQIVFSNRAFLNFFKLQDITPILGLMPGEAMGCDNAKESTGGCGASKNCSICGGIKSILSSLKTGSGIEEYTITGDSSAMVHLKVTTELIHLENREFIIYSLQDISSDKKKALLERLFYHDILNTAHNIHGMAELLSNEENQDGNMEYLGLLMKSTVDMIDEINTHRIISNGNHLDYISQPVTLNSFFFFKDMKLEFEAVETGIQRIAIDRRSENFTFTADKVLLKRVVTNMIKNALEAEQGKGLITMGLMSLNGKGAMIWVHNPAWMSEEVQMQVFNRSFSTKGADRGLGTYSMKMLTEKFMKGKISFTSTPSNGTTFIIEIPGKE